MIEEAGHVFSESEILHQIQDIEVQSELQAANKRRLVAQRPTAKLGDAISSVVSTAMEFVLTLPLSVWVGVCRGVLQAMENVGLVVGDGDNG